MTDPTGTLGVVFPITAAHFENLLSGKNVFCKFVGRLSVGAGNKIVFYQSGGSRQLVGEAIIKSIALMTPREAVQAFGNKLFITAIELEKYASLFKRAPTARLSVFELVIVRSYRAPVKFSRPIGPSGVNLTAEIYETIDRIDRSYSAVNTERHC